MQRAGRGFKALQAALLQQALQLARHRFAGIDNGHRYRAFALGNHFYCRLYKRVVGAAQCQGVGAAAQERRHITFQHGDGFYRIQLAFFDLLDQADTGLRQESDAGAGADLVAQSDEAAARQCAGSRQDTGFAAFAEDRGRFQAGLDADDDQLRIMLAQGFDGRRGCGIAGDNDGLDVLGREEGGDVQRAFYDGGVRLAAIRCMAGIGEA
ncbi:hypothetical protein D3C81_1613770 [compost metagenome]